jgi:hypothetical protein
VSRFLRNKEGKPTRDRIWGGGIRENLMKNIFENTLMN